MTPSQREAGLEKMARALIARIGSPWSYDKMDPMIKQLWHGHALAARDAWEAHCETTKNPGD